MKNIFEKNTYQEIVNRINQLTPETKNKWGKMNVSQMLAHCNVTYELVYEDKHPKPTGLMKFFLKAFVKNPVVNEKPYKTNSRTGPVFVISTEKDFTSEKSRLLAFLAKTNELGEAYFDNKESHSFGPLTKSEWNNMFYKHLDHHLKQFGV